MQAILCEANASFNSNKSISSIVKPARCNAFCVAGTGPIPIILGSTPAIAMLLMTAIGCKSYFFTALSDANNMAAAPSFTPLALAAVTLPSLENAGFNSANFSTGVNRGCSSFWKVRVLPFPKSISIGIISSSNRLALCACSYFN